MRLSKTYPLMTVGKSSRGCEGGTEVWVVFVRFFLSCAFPNVFCLAFDGHNDDCGEIFERLYGGGRRCGAAWGFIGFFSAVHFEMVFLQIVCTLVGFSPVCVFMLTVTIMTVGKSLKGCMGEGGGVGLRGDLLGIITDREPCLPWEGGYHLKPPLNGYQV